MFMTRRTRCFVCRQKDPKASYFYVAHDNIVAVAVCGHLCILNWLTKELSNEQTQGPRPSSPPPALTRR